MKKTVVLLLSVMMTASLIAGCGGKSETASETAASAANAVEAAAPEKSEKPEKKETITYRLYRFEAGEYVAEGADLKDNGMDGNTYVELSNDGTGVVCIMGTANDMTWDDSGSIKINNYPVYTLDRIDDETVAIDMKSSKFIMTSNEAVLAAAETSSAKVEAEDTEDKPAGNFDGVKRTYVFAGIEAGGVLQDSVQAYMNTGGAYEDTSLVLNGDGTGTLIMEGSEHEALWEDGGYIIQDLPNCSLDEIEDGMYEFNLYGMMKMRLMAEDYTNNKADRSNLKTMPYGSYDGRTYRSAGYINAAKTLMVSVFVNNDEFYWTDDAYDQETKKNLLKIMKTGTDWLSDKVALYGYDSQFIYNWEENPDLAYNVETKAEKISESVLSDSMDSEMMNEFDAVIQKANVKESALKQKYGADNLIYVLHVNDGGVNYTGSIGRDFATWTSNGQEYLVLYGSFTDYAGGAVAVAHETLHLFGAPDLYALNADGIITEDYIDYLGAINSNDIMFENSMDSFVGVRNDFGPVTAYYVGLEEEAPEDVAAFDLGKPEKKPLK